MATLIQIRRGTSSQWSSANPILASGELAISTDLEKIKIGDGSSTWSNLLYINLTPAEIQSAIDTSVSTVLDGAPALLDTLNELAAALGDDENFASTITNSLADKLDISTASSTYLTQANAASSYDSVGSASAAQTAAESYADSLAPNYDPAGSAATAESNSNLYTDTAVSNLVDSSPEALNTLNELAAALGDDANFATTVASQIGDKADTTTLNSHTSATTSVHGIADTSLLATTSYVDTAESDAVSTANAYSDSLASNYDSSGSAATAEGNANSYTDTEISTHNSDTTSVHGIADTSLLATTSYVDTAESDAISTSNSYADSLASNYDAAGTASSEVSTHNLDTTSVHGISDTSLLATTSYVDTAESDAVSTANTYSDSLASNYDSSGSASAVASDLTDHENATTSVHGIANTADLATKTYADNAAATAAANLVDSAPGTLDTLNELAAALGDDPNFATTISTLAASKLDVLDAEATYLTQSDAAATYLTQSDAAINYDPIGSGTSAQNAAQAYADSLAPNYDSAGSAAAAEIAATTAANAYSDSLATNYDPSGSAASAQSSAASYADSLAPNYDSAGSASAAQSAAELYADSLSVNYDAVGSSSTVSGNLTDHENATTDVHGISDTSELVVSSDSRLSDSRIPNSHAVSHEFGGDDQIEIDPSQVTGTAVVTSDSRLSDSRTPTAHASSHSSGGTDEILLSQSQITDLVSDLSAKAPLNNPEFTGNPIAPTQELGNSTTRIATTEFVGNATSAAQTAAEDYADSLSFNYDSLGSAAAAQTAAEDYADSLATNYDPAGSATTAQSNAESYADGVSATAQSNAEGYTDSSISTHNSLTTGVHGIVNTANLATIQYVDEVAQGLISRPSVLGATSTNLDAAYNNGTSGVDATLTANSNGVFPSDFAGSSGWEIFSGVLVKNQTNKSQNGRYYVSDMGTVSTPWILTRCPLCDTADEIPGSYIFVTDGTFASTGWVQAVDSPTTFVVGTDDIDVYQFSGAGTYTAGTGLVLTGNEFSLDSHSHSISDVTGLQAELDGKAETNQTMYVGTTSLAINRSSASQSLTGITSIDGSAESLTTARTLTIGSTGKTFNGSADVSWSLGEIGAQPVDADLTAISALLGTSGILKKTATDTWSLDTSSYLTQNQTITLSGDASGSGTDSIVVTVADDSHNHIISNVDGLQIALDGKLESSLYTAADILTKIKTVDGASSELDADLLDGQEGSYYRDAGNINAGTLAVARGGTGATASTGTGSVVLSASPTFTGVPISTTASVGTNNTQIATTAFVNAEISNDALLKTGGTLTGTASGVSPTAAGSNGFRNITMSTSAPSGGSDGDVWLVYT